MTLSSGTGSQDVTNSGSQTGFVEEATAKTILVAGLAATLLLLVVIVLEFLGEGAPLLAKSSKSATLALITCVLAVMGVIVIGLGWTTHRLVLYVFTLPCVLTNFFLVQASGGLTASPFIAFYPCLLTVAIILTKRPMPVIFVGSLVGVAMAFNAWLQFSAGTAAFVPNQSLLYYVKYYLVCVITLAIMGVADWRHSSAR